MGMGLRLAAFGRRSSAIKSRSGLSTGVTDTLSAVEINALLFTCVFFSRLQGIGVSGLITDRTASTLDTTDSVGIRFGVTECLTP